MEGITYLRPAAHPESGEVTAWADGPDAQVIAFPSRRSRPTVGRASCPEECMAELVAMLAEDGADVLAFARAVPARFRERLPADLRLAAGLEGPVVLW